jgi:hypothetical protein
VIKKYELAPETFEEKFEFFESLRNVSCYY